jgi:pSer/pThr/pTyr-binding forkhead associated (FHA) protein
MDTDLDNNEEPIFELASECETLFLQQISLLKEQRELNGAKILGNYQQRFAAWASFLGVFAGHNVCLDRRLRCHVDTQELVLRLLEILEKNLFLLFSRNELDTNMDIDESLSQSQQQPGQHKISADSLAAIDEAMKRLDQLGKAIRSSPMTSQVIKAKNYAARFDTTSFEEIAQFALRSLYPEASQTLVEQLSQSMLDTYVQFLYRQARKDPLRARRQAQKQLSTIVEGDDEMKVVSPIAETSDPKHLGKAPMVKLRRQGAELLSEYAPTSLDSREAQRKWKKGHPSLHRERKTKSLMSRQVAYPQMGKNSLTCEWCFTPISEEEAKGDEWIQHINADHKPYVCISEACAETSPRYASSSEWLKHMIDSHGRSWHKIVHPTVSWACPICEANVILPRPQDLTAHMQEAHDGVFSGTQIQAIVQQSKVATTRSAEICPICSLSMVDKEETLSKKRGAHALMPEDSNLTVVPVSFKRPRKDEAFGPREHPRSPQPVPDGYTTGEPADPVFNAPKSELIGKHIAGHLQSIMLLTLRLMSVGNETDSSALESDAESDAADLGQANSDSGTNASERSLPESSQSDSMSLDIDSLQKRAELVPDSHEEWDDMQTGRNGPTEDDPFMQQAVASGAFQSYEDTTQSTRFDEASFSGEALDNDPDVWGYLIPIDNQSTDAIILRRHQKSPTLETGKREPLSQRAHGYLIGRHQECDIIVKDPTVSNRHCIIFSKNVGSSNIAVLEDVSTNGTFVNDAIVGRNQSRVLQDRDEVAIMARARFLFRYPKNQAANSFDQQYMLLEELGRGHFAEVFLCVEKSTGQRYAVKIFNKTAGTKHHGLPEGLEGEIGMLMAVSHPNILCIKDAFHADKESRIHMVMELAPEGELFNYIDMNQKLDETKAHDVFTQLFNGVKYLVSRFS